MHEFDEGYFLSFPEVTVRRVSYAASFGLDTVKDTLEPELTRRLRGISQFACREHSGQQLIRKLTGKDARMVLVRYFCWTLTVGSVSQNRLNKNRPIF